MAMKTSTTIITLLCTIVATIISLMTFFGIDKSEKETIVSLNGLDNQFENKHSKRQNIDNSENLTLHDLSGKYSLVSERIEHRNGEDPLLLEHHPNDTMTISAKTDHKGVMQTINYKIVEEYRKSLKHLTLLENQLITKAISNGYEVYWTYEYSPPFLKLKAEVIKNHDVEVVWVKE